MLATMLALILALSSAFVPGTTKAFADDVPQSTGTQSNPAQAAITKIIEMPEDSVLPDALWFQFAFTPVSKNGVSAAFTTGIPSIPAIRMDFDEVNNDFDTYTTANGVKTFKRETRNVFDSTPSPVQFSEAGVFVYDVREEFMGWTVPPNDYSRFMSLARYKMTVFVKQAVDDQGQPIAGQFYPAIITTERTADDAGTATGVKVDPTPGESEMTFTNGYAEILDDENPETSTTAITLSKMVTGEFASKDAYFDFSLTVTKPALIISSTPVTYKAYVLDDDDDVVTTTDNGAIAGSSQYGPYIEITSGVTAQVSLKHNQRLVVTGTHAGTSFTATEAGTANYIPSVVTTVGGALAGNGSAQAGQSLSTGKPTPWYARSTGANHMAYTNTSDATSPTGLDTGDVPFVALVLICAGGLVAYFVVALRRRAKRRS
jgi:hypothetical protein